MAEPARKISDSLCPHGTHRIFAAENAAGSLGDLASDLHEKLMEMLCDVAEVAERGPSSVDFWKDESILWLRACGVMLLYSVDHSGRVMVHHVLANPEAAPEAH